VTDAELPPLRVGPDGPDGPLDVEVRRRRTRRKVLLVGAALAASGAAAVGAIGGSGAGSLAAFLVGCSLVVAIAAVVTLVGAVRDEHRGYRVPRRRIVVGVLWLLAAPVLLILAAGAGGAA
jgi:hypothetical protein